MKFYQLLLGVNVVLLSLIISYFLTEKATYIIHQDIAYSFESNRQFIPITTFNYDTINNRNITTEVKLTFADVTKAHELLLVMERKNQNNENVTWEKRSVELITTTDLCNTAFLSFNYAHDTIIENTHKVILYLWNKGGNSGQLQSSTVTLK